MNNKIDYRKFYNTDDSLKMVLYGLLVPYLAVFVLYAVYMIIGTSINMSLDDFLNQLPVILINSVYMQLCFIAIYFIFNQRKKINFATATKLDKKPNAWVFAIAICMGFAVMWFSSPFISLFEEGLRSLGFEIKGDLGFKLDNAGTIIFAFIALAIIPAFIEECIFRGVILQGFRHYGNWFAIIASALLFMLIHGNIQQTIYQFGFGVLAGWLVIKSGSLWTSIAIHAINNAIVILLQTLQDCGVTTAETLVLNASFIMQTIVDLILLALVLWLGIYLINKITKINNQNCIQTQNVKTKNKKEKNIIVNEDGSTQMSFNAGTKAFFSDKMNTKLSIIGLFVSLCLLIINSVAMII